MMREIKRQDAKRTKSAKIIYGSPQRRRDAEILLRIGVWNKRCSHASRFTHHVSPFASYPQVFFVGDNLDRAVLIGAVDAGACGLEVVEGLGRGVAVPVRGGYGDDCYFGLDEAEELG